MKVLVTPRSFAKNDKSSIDLLKQNGVEIVRNPTAGIMSEEEMIDAIRGCVGVIVGVDPLSRKVLEAAPSLRAIAKYGVGVDNIDLDYCEEKNIIVSRTIGANSEAVADYAFALILALARNIIEIDSLCRNGNWKKITTSDVAQQTLGLVGLGSIGKQMVNRAKGFGMKIMAYDVFWDDVYANENDIEKADIDKICQDSDFISLHLPLLPNTKKLIDKRRIGLMKASAYLVNTARGGLIDDDALLDALKDNRIAGAGLDAFAQEPPENKEWFKLKNIIIGSHCAASTLGAANNMSLKATQNILNDLGLIVNE